MNDQIEYLKLQQVVKFNFDNGLTLRAQFGNGLVMCSVAITASYRSGAGYRVIREDVRPQGADAFADYINTVSNYTSEQIALLKLSQDINATRLTLKQHMVPRVF